MKHKCSECGRWLPRDQVTWNAGKKWPVFFCVNKTACEKLVKTCGKDTRDYFEWSHGHKVGMSRPFISTRKAVVASKRTIKYGC